MATQSLGDRLRQELAQMGAGSVVLADVGDTMALEVIALTRDMDKKDQFRCLVLGQAIVDGSLSVAEANAAAAAGYEAVLALADRLAA